ncbi:MAG: response regulator [Thermogutta sp.]|nr:response regulator [Thermogutta sp.]HPU07619.1 response regulator [Thermogutta sp.]HPZ83487.1 response regulator [Thermogutta sp.]
MQVFQPWLLIADDDQRFRETIQNLLEEEGYRTVTAADGEEAVRIVATREVHIVLLDFHMPKLTGLDALKLVRQVRGLLPCILMSAALDANLIEQARQQAVFEILRKPFSARQLSSVVRSALEQSYRFLPERI